MISVIVPCYNGAALVRRCLDSVLAQTRKPAEIIVVNDGSTDESARIVAGYGAKVRYFEQINQGAAAARNVGFRAATGKYVAMIDADDYWLPGFLRTCVEFLESHPEAIAVSVGQRIKTWGHEECTRPAILADDSPSRPKEPCVLEDFFGFWAEHNHITTGSNVIRREAILQVGGQREDLRECEDLELWGLVATMGPWGFVPEVLLVCDGSGAAAAGGWLSRHRLRWRAAFTMEQWESRIVPRLKEKDWAGYRIMRGSIAKSVAHTRALGGFDDQALHIVRKFGDSFPSDRVARVLRLGAASGNLRWKACCRLLRFREWTKAALYSFRRLRLRAGRGA